MFRNPTTDLIVILVIVLLIFGPKRLPSLGRQLGQGLREFKDSITGDRNEEPERPQIQQTTVGAASDTRPSQYAREPDSAEVGSAERRS